MNEVSGTEFHISEMEQTSKYILRSWMRHMGHLVAETCWRLWRICCYSAVLGIVLCITRYQKFTEAVHCWLWHMNFTYAHKTIWGMSEALLKFEHINVHGNHLLASLLLDFIGPKFFKDHIILRDIILFPAVPLNSQIYQYRHHHEISGFFYSFCM